MVQDGNLVGVRGRIQDRVKEGRLRPKGLHGSVDLSNLVERCLCLKMSIHEIKG